MKRTWRPARFLRRQNSFPPPLERLEPVQRSELRLGPSEPPPSLGPTALETGLSPTLSSFQLSSGA